MRLEGEGTGTVAQRKGTQWRAPGRTRRNGMPQRRDQPRPTPTGHCATPGGARPRHTPPKQESDAIRTTPAHGNRTPETTQGKEGHPHGEKGLHPQTTTPRKPPRSPPPRPHRQATTPATAGATSQAPEEEEGAATAPGARGKNPQRARDQSTGPQEGQPRGQPPDPRARAAHPDHTARAPQATPHLTASPNHQPATLRPALCTTTRARPNTTDPPWHNTRQHGTPHCSPPACNAPRQGAPRHDTPQHDAARRGTARHTTARHGATRHDTARRTATQHGPAGRSRTKDGTTQHVAPQHTTTPKQGTVTEGLTEPIRRTPRKVPQQPTMHGQGATARPATTVEVRPHKRPPES